MSLPSVNPPTSSSAAPLPNGPAPHLVAASKSPATKSPVQEVSHSDASWQPASFSLCAAALPTAVIFGVLCGATFGAAAGLSAFTSLSTANATDALADCGGAEDGMDTDCILIGMNADCEGEGEDVGVAGQASDGDFAARKAGLLSRWRRSGTSSSSDYDDVFNLDDSNRSKSNKFSMPKIFKRKKSISSDDVFLAPKSKDSNDGSSVRSAKRKYSADSFSEKTGGTTKSLKRSLSDMAGNFRRRFSSLGKMFSGKDRRRHSLDSAMAGIRKQQLREQNPARVYRSGSEGDLSKLSDNSKNEKDPLASLERMRNLQDKTTKSIEAQLKRTGFYSVKKKSQESDAKRDGSNLSVFQQMDVPDLSTLPPIPAGCAPPKPKRSLPASAESVAVPPKPSTLQSVSNGADEMNLSVGRGADAIAQKTDYDSPAESATRYNLPPKKWPRTFEHIFENLPQPKNNLSGDARVVSNYRSKSPTLSMSAGDKLTTTNKADTVLSDDRAAGLQRSIPAIATGG